MSVKIRPARAGELEAVLGIWREAEAMPGATDSVESLRMLLETSPDSLLVAEVDSAPVGTVIATWDGWRAGLYRLAVLPSHRRRGVARALIAEGERRLRDKGAARISILAIASSDAPDLWEAVGYESDGRIRRFVKNLLPLALLLAFLTAGCGGSHKKQQAEPRPGPPGAPTTTTRGAKTATATHPPPARPGGPPPAG